MEKIDWDQFGFLAENLCFLCGVFTIQGIVLKAIWDQQLRL